MQSSTFDELVAYRDRLHNKSLRLRSNGDESSAFLIELQVSKLDEIVAFEHEMRLRARLRREAELGKIRKINRDVAQLLDQMEVLESPINRNTNLKWEV